MLIIILTRVSTEEQGRSGYSLPEQLKACRARAAELAGSEQATILEFGDEISGEILERPGLQSALQVIRSQRVDYFICLDPDRFARKLLLQLLITEEIEKSGCNLEFIQHDYQQTAEGRLFYQMRGAFAEFEKLKIVERTSRGARGKIAMGGLPHVIRLYGYQFIKGAGKVVAAKALIPDPIESKMVYTMMRWCAEEGIGPTAIAARLRELGVPTKTGVLWQHTQVRRILRHEVYATGRLALGRHDHKGLGVARQLPADERRRRGITLTPKPLPQETWQYVHVQPIVPPELWEQVQDVLNGFRIGGRADNHPSRFKMLTSLGECAQCGSPLYYFSGRKVVCFGRYRHYWRAGVEPTDCQLPAKPSAAVEEAVWAAVRSWLLDPEAWTRAVRLVEAEQAPVQREDLLGVQTELSALQEQMAAKKSEQERIGLLFSKGLWPADMALPTLETIGKEIHSLGERIDDLNSRVNGSSRPSSAPQQSPLSLLLHDRAWREQAAITADQLDAARRTELVRLAVGKFIMHPTGRGEKPQVTVYPRV